MELESRILEAFPAEQVPGEPLLEAAYLDPEAQGDEGAKACFLGRRWTEISLEDLAYHRAAMYMFTPAAHAYYLPAFMFASLAGSELSGTIERDLVFHLASHRDPFWAARIRVLSDAQRGVIADFLDTTSDSGDQQAVARAKAGLLVPGGNT